MKPAIISPPAKRGTARPALSLEFFPIASIKSNPYNAREHDRKQIEKLKRSVERFGFVTPLIVADSNQLLKRSRSVGKRQAAWIRGRPGGSRKSSERIQQAGFRPCCNRLAELATWNQGSLRRELSFLSDLDVDFDFAAIGFGAR